MTATLEEQVRKLRYQPRFGDDGTPFGLTDVLTQCLAHEDPDVRAAAQALADHYKVAA